MYFSICCFEKQKHRNLLFCIVNSLTQLRFASYCQILLYDIIIQMSLFRDFLIQISSKPLNEVSHFVMGNSSVDYDTFFGSIIMAFLLTQTTKQLHLPIIDCEAEEVKYRFQINQILKKTKIDYRIFKYKNQFENISKKSWFSLYDHNYRENVSNVECIIDHHDAKDPKANRYLISKMGSALTNLYYLMNPSKLAQIKPQNQEQETYKQMFYNFVKDQPLGTTLFEEKPQLEVEELIRYGILMDTFNLDPKQKDRWTVYDQKALEFIESKQKFQIGYHELEELKFNEELNKELSLEAALAKDYKWFDYKPLTIEYSIIYLTPKNFYHHYHKEIHSWFKQNPPKKDIYMLMSVTKGPNNHLTREVMFIINNNKEKNLKLIEEFLIQLKMEKRHSFEQWHVWKDPSCTISRKKFDKEFRSYYQNINK